jgi:hypothetical protein
MSQVEKIFDNRDRVMQRDDPVDDQLRRLIQEKNCTKQTTYEFDSSAQDGLSERKTSEHRGQTVGCLESFPISSLYFQQRSHFRPEALRTSTRPPRIGLKYRTAILRTAVLSNGPAGSHTANSSLPSSSLCHPGSGFLNSILSYSFLDKE